jgi:hypothetical protein
MARLNPRMGFRRVAQQAVKNRLQATLKARPTAPGGFPGLRPLYFEPPLFAFLRSLWTQQIRAGLKAKLGLLDAVRQQLAGLDHNLASSAGTYGVAAQYDVSEESGSSGTSATTTSPSTSTTPETPAPEPTTEPSAAKPPSNRVLYGIFERLDKDDFTEDNYPKIRVVNDILEDRGHARASKGTVDAAYDRWTHVEAREEHEGEEDEDEHRGRKKPTKRAVYQIFEEIEHKKGNEKYYTESGFPRRDVVADRLEDRGYEAINSKTLHDWYEDFEKDEKREGEGEREGEKKATKHIVYQIFEELEGKKKNKKYFTESGFPRRDIVADRLEDRGYKALESKTLHDWYEDFEKDEKHEGEGEGEGEAKKATKHVAYEIFDDLEGKKGNKKYFTESGFPRHDVVADRLADRGYESIDSKTIQEWYEDFEKHEERESHNGNEGEGKKPKGSR